MLNPLPTLLQTPSGLALLELQGTINLPSRDEDEEDDDTPTSSKTYETSIGRLVFPEYVEGAEDGAWMKRMHLYVGKHQRLPGEVKKLGKALAIMRKKRNTEEGNDNGDELEIVEIVKWKIIFSHRPEPVGDDEEV